MGGGGGPGKSCGVGAAGAAIAAAAVAIVDALVRVVVALGELCGSRGGGGRGDEAKGRRAGSVAELV